MGGDTSAYADVRTAMRSDQKLIFPVAALLVGVILVILLRSLAVPLFVMTGVALGFAAALGASVIAFQGVGGDEGSIFSLPVVVYLFVASMVSDYAILVLSRVREELADGRTPAEAAAIALRTAGPSVAAAGLVLAAAFGVLVHLAVERPGRVRRRYRRPAQRPGDRPDLHPGAHRPGRAGRHGGRAASPGAPARGPPELPQLRAGAGLGWRLLRR